MVALDDQLYIQRVLDGNTSSFTSLVEKYKDMVFTVCFRILRQREDAEDVAQQVFLKAFRNLHAFQGKSRFSTWLYTIAYRTAISQSRVNQQHLHRESDENLSMEPLAFPQLDEMHAADVRTYVHQAIEALPVIDSVLISLYYLDECSIQEIVDITELSETNVKVRLHRARKLLKEQLELLLHHEIHTFRS